MINFKESSITKLLPTVLGNTEEVRAISYALNKQLNKLIEHLEHTLIWSSIESLDSNMLDILAAELRTHYYDELLDVQTKRKLVAGTMERYKIAGTRHAVEELIGVVFGNGEVEEWFEYGGVAHHFRIKTSNPITKGEQADEFIRLLEAIKRKSAHLESIEIQDVEKVKLYVSVISREIEVQRGEKINVYI